MSGNYMNEELFSELAESVREGGAICRGEKEASRTFVISPPDVLRIRERYGLTQTELAALLGVGVDTVAGWEEGKESPQGAVRVLLQVADKHPEAVWDVVQCGIE